MTTTKRMLENNYLKEIIANVALKGFKYSDNGTIMSTMIGAGKKDSSNAFYGVLMGDIGSASKGKTGIGLYGFHQGAQSFCFNVDGTAFLGKSGRGRITFNGDQGTIQSGNYIKNTSGMQINLEQGAIDAYNFKLTSKYVTIDSSKSGKDDEYTYSYASSHFTIKGHPYKIDPITGKETETLDPEKLTTLFTVGSSACYLQSANYSASASGDNASGMKIDLVKGRIDAKKLKITSELITIDSTGESTNYFVFKDKDKKTLMNVGSGSYFLQSSNYKTGTSGTYINLNTGYIYSKQFDMISEKLTMSHESGFSLSSFSNGSGIYCSNIGKNINFNGSNLSGVIFQAGSNFAVTSSGSIHALQGIFKGDITGASGTFSGSINVGQGSEVGGWTITNSSIKSTGDKIVLNSNGTIVAKSGATIGGCTFDANGNLTVKSINIGAGAVGTDALANGSVTAAKISSINANTITSGTISADLIDAREILVNLNNSYDDYGYLTIGKSGYTAIEIGTSGNGGVGGIGIYGKKKLHLATEGDLSIRGTEIEIWAFSSGEGVIKGTWTFPSGAATAAAFSVDSDLNKKNTINTISDIYENFFDDLRPVTYKYNNGTSDRLHVGFIAQEVENSLLKFNISSQDFAGLVKQNKKDEDGNVEINYQLRYDEFIGLNTWQIQKLKKELQLLKEKVFKLELKG